MRHRKILSAIVLLAGFGSMAFANPSDNAKHYMFQGLAFGSSVASMKAQLDNPIPVESQTDSKIGRETYAVSIPGGADLCGLSYFEDRLYLVVLVYAGSRVKSIGGADVIWRALVDRYGYPSPDSPAVRQDGGSSIDLEFFWHFAEAERYITLKITPDAACVVSILDTAQADALDAKTKNSVMFAF